MKVKDSLSDFWFHAFSSDGKDTRFEFWVPGIFSIVGYILLIYGVLALDEWLFNPGDGMSIGVLLILIPPLFFIFLSMRNSAVRRFRDIGLSDKTIGLIQLLFNSMFIPFTIYYLFSGFKDNQITNGLMGVGSTGIMAIIVVSLIILTLPTDWMLKRETHRTK
ncbi:DUF805 domain-containing protein [Macrococcus lamae]|uniref:DUF805 domain-containing protein n=1 Tax=Macrococcus lamae TaxID=198484 RepID=A0A4R6BW89_9STAP|nr:DUF805 domain-containing protein [Macrococcus lamae]TDM12290.1 hypothetical protein ERX29_04300 [Macrococcus lamae]